MKIVTLTRSRAIKVLPRCPFPTPVILRYGIKGGRGGSLEAECQRLRLAPLEFSKLGIVAAREDWDFETIQAPHGQSLPEPLFKPVELELVPAYAVQVTPNAWQHGEVPFTIRWAFRRRGIGTHSYISVEGPDGAFDLSPLFASETPKQVIVTGR